MKRAVLFLTTALISLYANPAQAQGAPAPQRPNFLIIVADDLGFMPETLGETISR